MPRTTPDGTGRATGVSLAAIVLVLGCFGAMVVLHAVRTDLDPVRQVMSEYANGRFGWFMTVAFYAIGLACVALAVRLGRAIVRRRLSVAVRVLLALGGLGLVLAGVFEVERPAVPDTIEEVIHSYATLTAFTLIITAMLLFAVVCRQDPRWQGLPGDRLRARDHRRAGRRLQPLRRPDDVERTGSACARTHGRRLAAALCAAHTPGRPAPLPAIWWRTEHRTAHAPRGDPLSNRLRLIAIGLLLSSAAGLVLLHLLRRGPQPRE